MSENVSLSKQLQQKLLRIARETIEQYIRTRTVPEFSVQDPELQRMSGAFVTLKSHGRLRGCIGHVEGIKPLYQTIIDMAIASATEDPRFAPVRESEFADLHLEISVMSPLKKIDQVEDIEVGTHGLLMKRGFRSGLLLPQVASERHWDRQTFLEHTCMKAGLPRMAWNEPETEIYIFSAQVFQEETV